MKKLIYLAVFAIALSGCSKTIMIKGNGNPPPGQVKKVTGSQSAKPYAPGQKKKN